MLSRTARRVRGGGGHCYARRPTAHRPRRSLALRRPANRPARPARPRPGGTCPVMPLNGKEIVMVGAKTAIRGCKSTRAPRRRPLLR